MTLYFAGPLFSAERHWNTAPAGRLRAVGHEVFLAQDHEKSKDAAGIVATDCGRLARSDAPVAIIVRPAPDSGIVREYGWA